MNLERIPSHIAILAAVHGAVINEPYLSFGAFAGLAAVHGLELVQRTMIDNYKGRLRLRSGDTNQRLGN